MLEWHSFVGNLTRNKEYLLELKNQTILKGYECEFESRADVILYKDIRYKCRFSHFNSKDYFSFHMLEPKEIEDDYEIWKIDNVRIYEVDGTLIEINKNAIEEFATQLRRKKLVQKVSEIENNISQVCKEMSEEFGLEIGWSDARELAIKSENS